MFKHYTDFRNPSHLNLFKAACAALGMDPQGYEKRQIGNILSYSIPNLVVKALPESGEAVIISTMSRCFPTSIKIRGDVTEYADSGKTRVVVNSNGDVSVNIPLNELPSTYSVTGVMVVRDHRGFDTWPGMENGIMPRRVQGPTDYARGKYMESLDAMGIPYVISGDEIKTLELA